MSDLCEILAAARAAPSGVRRGGGGGAGSRRLQIHGIRAAGRHLALFVN